MSLDSNSDKLGVGELARKLHDELIPLSNSFSYFFAAVPLTDEDVQEYLREPIAALPPSLIQALPNVAVLLVPYLERVTRNVEGRQTVEDLVSFDDPGKDNRIWSSKLQASDGVVLAFAVKDQDVADYHYGFYHMMADVAVDIAGRGAVDEFNTVLRDELSGGVHGEVDDQSWELKTALLRKQRDMRRKTKGFSAYARQSLLDTLTLYLHGICCDIDVETGPRQIASRHLRRRLELLQSIYPPPEGYTIFPEDLNHVDEAREKAPSKD